MHGHDAGSPEDRTLVTRLWGWVRGRRDEEGALEPTFPVEAGRVRIVHEGSVPSDHSPFDTTLDECATVITSAPRL